MFESARLAFYRPVESDLDLQLHWLKDVEVMRFEGGPFTDELAHNYRLFVLKHWSDYGFGHFIMVEKSTGETVGNVSLKFLKPEHARDRVVDMGCLIFTPFQRNGYAEESVRALLKYGVEALGIKRVEATNHPSNTASVWTLEKLGFRLEGEIDLTAYGRDFGKSQRWVVDL